MRSDKGADAALPRKPRHDLVEFDTVVNVQERRRLVQKHHLRPLADRPGDRAPLPLSRRKLPERPRAQLQQAAHLQSAPGFATVLRGRSAEEPLVRKSPERHVLFHRHREIDRGVLPHDGEETGHLPPAVGCGRAPQQGHFPGMGRKESRKDFQERALPHPVRAQEDGNLPVPDVQVHPREDFLLPVSEPDPLRRQDLGAHGFPPSRRSR